jgi:hypothetical protein
MEATPEQSASSGFVLPTGPEQFADKHGPSLTPSAKSAR